MRLALGHRRLASPDTLPPPWGLANAVVGAFRRENASDERFRCNTWYAPVHRDRSPYRRRLTGFQPLSVIGSADPFAA